MFGNKEQVNLFPEVSGEKTFYIRNQKQTIRLDDNFLRIARGGAINAILHGFDGEKSILLNSITGYQLKEPGGTVGYLQVNYPGSQETKGGTRTTSSIPGSGMSWVKDYPNSTTSSKKQAVTHGTKRHSVEQTNMKESTNESVPTSMIVVVAFVLVFFILFFI